MQYGDMIEVSKIPRTLFREGLITRNFAVMYYGLMVLNGLTDSYNWSDDFDPTCIEEYDCNRKISSNMIEVIHDSSSLLTTNFNIDTLNSIDNYISRFS